ncbi:MAG: hypothetical protein ABSH01_26440 [Terriglobia bacterium]
MASKKSNKGNFKVKKEWHVHGAIDGLAGCLNFLEGKGHTIFGIYTSPTAPVVVSYKKTTLKK